MYDFSRNLFILLTILGLSGCAPLPVQTNSPTVLNFHIYEGLINKEFYELTQRVPERSTIIIDSPGGSETFGILAGQRIIEKQIKLIVRGVCLSSCANYIATASTQITLEEQSVIGFHGTNFNNGLTSNKKEENLRNLNNLFERSGVDQDLIFCAELVLFTGEFESIDHTFANGVTKRVRVPLVRKKMWIPSVEVMSRYGLQLNGEQPETAAAAAEIIGSNLDPGDLEMDAELVNECAAET